MALDWDTLRRAAANLCDEDVTEQYIHDSVRLAINRDSPLIDSFTFTVVGTNLEAIAAACHDVSPLLSGEDFGAERVEAKVSGPAFLLKFGTLFGYRCLSDFSDFLCSYL